jgi:Putative restriction endonuclease
MGSRSTALRKRRQIALDVVPFGVSQVARIACTHGAQHKPLHHGVHIQNTLYEYRAAGIPEYWLIDPDLRQAEFYQLDAAGRYQVVAAGTDGVYRSRALPGFWLREEWLWQEPLPDVVRTLLEIDGAAYAAYLREQLRQAGQ